MGLNGSNDFIKASSDSWQWREALKIDHAISNVAVGSICSQTRLHVDGLIRSASYAVTELPSAGSHGAGVMVFVTKAPSGAEMAYSDGPTWRGIRSGTVIA